MKLGVIVARFQANQLTCAQALLINQALVENDKVLICLGHRGSKLTLLNPMSYEVRAHMLTETYKPFVAAEKLFLHPISDKKYNDVWSDQLDSVIEAHILETFMLKSSTEVLIYGGRDSFRKHYSGKHTVKEVTYGIDHVNTTEIREQIHKTVQNDVKWREGIIYASANKYPVSYQAVDAAIIWEKPHPSFDDLAKSRKPTINVLLGRKPAEKLFRFPGGMVDPSDQSLEAACQREVSEECGPIQTKNYEYIGSYRIDDWRYKHEPDKIMTAFYACTYLDGTPKGGDDLAEVKWFELNTIKKEHLEPEHHVLLDALNNYFKK